MWDVIWYLGFPMFAINVFAAPYKKHYDNDRSSPYNADQYDVIYDQRQNGNENYKVNVDGLSFVWSSNSLLAAAALLEPALYGEYPETNIDIVLGPDDSKPEENKPLIEEKPNKPSENTSSTPSVLVIEGNQNPENKPGSIANMSNISTRKFHLPELLKSFLRFRPPPARRVQSEN